MSQGFTTARNGGRTERIAPAGQGTAFLLLFAAAGAWFVVASVLGLIASIKFHQPNFLADPAWLTYGRIRPAYLTALVYGGCLQLGIAVGLSILARLGRVPLPGSGMHLVGALFWNIGIGMGTIGILAGDRTGFENLEMPSYGIWVSLFGYLVWAIAAVLAFRDRSTHETFVSQWYLFAAAFWFPWIYTTAGLLLVNFPVRGVVQAVIAWWFSANLLVVWMGLVGLAAIFYLLPRMVQRDLYSHQLALFSFWILLLFGSWSGIPKTAPVPAWMVALSAVATVLTVLALITVALNVFRTAWRGVAAARWHRFVRFGVCAFLVAGLMRIGAALLDRAQNLDFSWFAPALNHLHCYGFFAMVLFGGAYYFMSCFSDAGLPWPKLAGAHFWLAAIGTILIVVTLASAGIFESIRLADPKNPFAAVMKSTLMFLRFTTLGDLLILLGHAAFLTNVAGLIAREYKSKARALCAAAVSPVEVKS